jgi:hypothetical protein
MNLTVYPTPMEKRKKKIEDFFVAYEEQFNSALAGSSDDVGEVSSGSFAECFIASSPSGVVCGTNGPEFIDNIKKGIEFYRSIGSLSMNILDREITLLDQDHATCKVTWQYMFTKDDKEDNIDFDVYYFLRTFDDTIKIFAYITGDEQKALREKGLIP